MVLCKTLEGVVDSVPPDKGREVLGGELTNEYLDKNDSKNVADSDDDHSLQKKGGSL